MSLSHDKKIKVDINRTQRKIEIASHGKICADIILEDNGYKYQIPLDIVNYDNIKWQGIEFNNLFVKDGILYRFNNWTGERHPYTGIEIEEIGKYSIVE